MRLMEEQTVVFLYLLITSSLYVMMFDWNACTSEWYIAGGMKGIFHLFATVIESSLNLQRKPSPII